MLSQCKSLDNSMKKYEYLQSSTKLSQLEARLNLNPYLSKTSLPTGVDAKVFLHLTGQRKIPNQQIHPNLYHWFILMKQFSPRTLEIWQQQSNSLPDDDRLIAEYIQSEINAAPRDVSTANRDLKRRNTLKQKHLGEYCEGTTTPEQSSIKNLNVGTEETSGGVFSKNIILNDCQRKVGQNEGLSGMAQSSTMVECMMEMQLKPEERTPIEEFKERLEGQKLSLVSLEGEEEKLRVVFKTQGDEIEDLKDRISQWDQIANIQFRKQKKVSSKCESKSQKLLSPEKCRNNSSN